MKSSRPNSSYTESQDNNEILFLMSFYKSIDTKFLDEHFNIKMDEKKPFICSTVVPVNKYDNTIKTTIYPGEETFSPCFGFTIDINTSEIICGGLKDIWSSKNNVDMVDKGG